MPGVFDTGCVALPMEERVSVGFFAFVVPFPIIGIPIPDAAVEAGAGTGAGAGADEDCFAVAADLLVTAGDEAGASGSSVTLASPPSIPNSS